MNHRAVQRTLFRMLLDEDFRARVLDGGELEGFDRRERSLLESASPACLSADRGGKRRGQILGNLVGEYVLSFAVSPASAERRGFPAAFFTTDLFHDAVMRDRRLPLAFAEYIESVAEREGDAAFSSFVALEAAMARARRGLRGDVSPGESEIVIAPGVELVELPGGTVALAERMRAALDAGERPPSVDALGGGSDREVAMAVGRPAANPRALADVAVEVLTPAVATVLAAAARCPQGVGDRAALAIELGAEPAALEEFVDSLVQDGVVRRG